MATYSELVDRIVLDVARGDTSITDTVKLHVLDSIEHYSTRRFWFNEASGALTTSAAAAVYSAPTDCLEIDHATISINGTKYPLKRTTYKDIDSRDDGLTSADPYLYAQYAQQLRFYPVPDKTYTVSLTYQKYIATLSATSDSNSWTTVAQELIRARTEKVLYGFRFHDVASAQMMQVAEDQALERLEEQTQKHQSTGKLKGYW